MKCSNVTPLENRECGEIPTWYSKIRAVYDYIENGSTAIDSGNGLEFFVNDLKYLTALGDVKDCKFYNSNGEVVFQGKYIDGLKIVRAEEKRFVLKLLDDAICENPPLEDIKTQLISNGFFKELGL